jgi:shikimate kinase
LIVRKSGRESIAEIFETGGETAFRQLEAAVSQDLQHRDNAVISTGGGVVMDPAIMDHLATNAVVVELAAPFDTILKRISPTIPRPLFKDEAQARALYERRKPLYSTYATVHVGTDNTSVEEVVEAIVSKVQQS